MENMNMDKIMSVKATVICGHDRCQTQDARWMCIDNIYQKLQRPNYFDIGGTYIQDVADHWFIFKTEQVGNIFLLHLFINNRQEGLFSVSVSHNSELKLDKKYAVAYLPKTLKKCQILNPKEKCIYINTYSFSEFEVDLLKNMKLYIAVSFSESSKLKCLNQDIVDSIKMEHDFAALLSDPICSDFIIESGDGEKFKVHKVLLSTHSEVFKAMLKEDTAECQNGCAKLINVSSEDLAFILEFIYTGTLKDDENCNFINLLTLADQYNIVGLKELSQYALLQHLNIENATETLVVADMYNSDFLKMNALNFIKKYPKVLESDQFKELKNTDLIREVCQYIASPL